MIKSQDNLNTCNEGKRKSDVLIATIEKCEKLEEKLKIAKEALDFIVKTLPPDRWIDEKDLGNCFRSAQQALEKIKV